MSCFSFLAADFPEIHAEAVEAERLTLLKPRMACIYARRVVEQSVKWAFRYDRSLSTPFETTVSAMLHDPVFKALAGQQIFQRAKDVNKIGNRAVHETTDISQRDAVTALSGLFEFTFWLARTYGKAKPDPALKFDPSTLPSPASIKAARDRAQATQAEAKELADKLAAVEAEREAERQETEAELAELRAQVAAAKAAAEATPDTHDYSESDTRDWFIDKLLGEAGWTLTEKRNREFPVTGMPGGKNGLVDYVLWGEDGLPLAVVEAKRTRISAKAGQEQARLYADCLEQAYGRRPVIYYSNGYDHWLWDDQMYAPRSVQGFHTRDELELMIQRRTTRASLAETDISGQIVERYYQERAIRAIGRSFEADNERKALLVMATGSGKTRTVIALADQLMRANWAKRVLFLADRQELVKQAVGVFKAFLPDSAPVNLLDSRDEEGRIYVSTYPTMLNLINEATDGERRFGIGHFDLVVIDEAHRSVFKKYRAIFEHFDSLLVGLTATPREEIDRNTYDLFDLQPGVPTDAYDLAEAVADGYLVPPKVVAHQLRFVQEGIRYDDLSDEDKETWDELEWDEDDHDAPDRVGAEALNTWLFNADTVDKVIETLMTKGLHVAGGDRLGKTIIFAKNQDHADFIVERFDKQYPHLKGVFARTITHKVEHAGSLIEKFKVADQPPYIAVSVDMLDTGIDVPEVVNLVFFKTVRSKTKFWQMVGRGTRLCPDLFGPDEDKTHFLVFDFCGNFEYFDQEPETTDAPAPPSLSARLFARRLDLVGSLQASGEHADLRASTVDLLWKGICAVNVDNVVARPHRQVIERFKNADAWTMLSVEDMQALATEAAELPNSLPAEREEPKRFDLLILRLQLAVIEADPAFVPLREQVKLIASLLEEQASIPMIKAELDLIVEVQTDQWWEDVTLPMLEALRRRLRSLVQLIEKRRRKPVFTNFADELGDGVELEVPGLVPGTGFEQFRRKAAAYLKTHTNQLVIEKIHRNRPITATDLAELEAILVAEGIGSTEDIAEAAASSGGLGVFIRSLVGLDRAAAKELFADFLDEGSYTATQIHFVNMIIDDLTQNGIVDAARIYESPFTDTAPTGPEDLFPDEAVADIVARLNAARAAAATTVA